MVQSNDSSAGKSLKFEFSESLIAAATLASSDALICYVAARAAVFEGLFLSICWSVTDFFQARAAFCAGLTASELSNASLHAALVTVESCYFRVDWSPRRSCSQPSLPSTVSQVVSYALGTESCWLTIRLLRFHHFLQSLQRLAALSNYGKLLFS